MMVVFEICGGLDDTACTGWMKYLTLDPRYEPTEDIIRNISKHRWTNINRRISQCNQTFDIHRALIGYYLCCE